MSNLINDALYGYLTVSIFVVLVSLWVNYTYRNTIAKATGKRVLSDALEAFFTWPIMIYKYIKEN